MALTSHRNIDYHTIALYPQMGERCDGVEGLDARSGGNIMYSQYTVFTLCTHSIPYVN